jgi:heme exporter protein CcmD
MDISSPHFGFVLTAYILSFAVLAGLLMFTLAQRRKLAAKLNKVDPAA